MSPDGSMFTPANRGCDRPVPRTDASGVNVMRSGLSRAPAGMDSVYVVPSAPLAVRVVGTVGVARAERAAPDCRVVVTARGWAATVSGRRAAAHPPAGLLVSPRRAPAHASSR